MKCIFCEHCRKEQEYKLKKVKLNKVIRGKAYEFVITGAYCETCGERVTIPGILDLNALEIDKQYRQFEDIVTIDEIRNIMEIYQIGKTPLSIVLGFGEITIPRYLDGQVPSKQYSEILKKALRSPKYMKEKLLENKEKITTAAFKKSMKATDELIHALSISTQMMNVICMILEELGEVSPLMLQKLLYYTQGVSLALNHEPIFEEDCQAWVHGPVYPTVYQLFKGFSFNPIDDQRYAIIKNIQNVLSVSQQNVVHLVANTFGIYGAKSLEKLTHKEKPWLLSRQGYDEGIPSQEVITKDLIKAYFLDMHRQYDFTCVEGINKYINEILNK